VWREEEMEEGSFYGGRRGGRESRERVIYGKEGWREERESVEERR
jgi:hypothetical protein